MYVTLTTESFEPFVSDVLQLPPTQRLPHQPHGWVQGAAARFLTPDLQSSSKMFAPTCCPVAAVHLQRSCSDAVLTFKSQPTAVQPSRHGTS
jgi:hypothetical protein